MSITTFSFSLLSLIRTFWLIAGEPLPQYPFAPWSPTILLWAVQIARWGSMTEECWEQELRVRNDSCSAFQPFVLLCIRFTVEQICATWFNDYIYKMLLSKATYSAFRPYIYCQNVCSLGIEPTTFALQTQCSTTEPQEHLIFYF